MKRTEAKVVLGLKTDAARFFAIATDNVNCFADIAALEFAGVMSENKDVVDECDFAPKMHDHVGCAKGYQGLNRCKYPTLLRHIQVFAPGGAKIVQMR
jgi:hypothetical protein